MNKDKLNKRKERRKALKLKRWFKRHNINRTYNLRCL